VARWIDDYSDGSDAVRQIERESVNDRSAQRLRLLAAGLNIGHLDIGYSIECADHRGKLFMVMSNHATRPDPTFAGGVLGGAASSSPMTKVKAMISANRMFRITVLP
jgi:hypothetical protein